MKIDINITPLTKFCEVPLGETFYYVPSGVMWIKLNFTLCDEDKNSYNAVALDDGIPTYFADNDMVMIIPTKLINA